jgi:organic radical activating enzyme
MKKQNKSILDEIDELISRRQKNYGTQLTISLTNRCPLQCEHCIVNASYFRGNDLDQDMIRHIGEQLHTLQGSVKLISVTGGEPFLREYELKLLLKMAHPWLKIGVVTSGYWARSLNDAIDLVNEYPEISHYNISTDIYHQRFVPLEYIRNAYQAVKSRQKTAVIRFTEGYGSSEIESQLLREIQSFAGNEVAVQDLIPFGRAGQLKQQFPYTAQKPPIPCLSDGPLICEDGKVLPCCSALASIKNEHPLILGSVKLHELPVIYKNIHTNTIFQFLRLWGSGRLFQLLKATSLSGLLPKKHLDFNPCYTCAMLFSKPEICEYLTKMALDAEVRLKVASGLWHYFQDPIFIDELFYNNENFKSEVIAKCR